MQLSSSSFRRVIENLQNSATVNVILVLTNFDGQWNKSIFLSLQDHGTCKLGKICLFISKHESFTIQTIL